MCCSWDLDANLQCAEALIREVAERGAQAVLIHELFEAPYSCTEQDFKYLQLASGGEDNRAVQHMRGNRVDTHLQTF